MRPLIFVAILLSSSALLAQEAAPNAPPTPAPTAPPAATRVPPTPTATLPPVPPPEMEQIAVFAGSWTCEGTLPGEPPLKTRAETTITRDLNDYWYSARSVTRIEGGTPKEVTRLIFASFDPVMKQFVGGWVDSRGDWLTHTAPGWTGDTLVFLGHLQSTAVRKMTRETFTRPTAEAGFKRTFEIMDLMKRSWVVLAEETCRKGQ